MPDSRVFVLSLVERGWQAARICSLEAAERGVNVTHLVKGMLPPDVTAIVCVPAGMRLRSCAKPLFWLQVWLICAWGIRTGKLRAVLVDNERSVRRLSSGLERLSRLLSRGGLKPMVVWAQPAPEGYALLTRGVPLSRQSWYHALDSRP